MKITEKLSVFAKNSALSVRRFPFTLTCILLTTVVSWVMIFATPGDFAAYLLSSFGYGAFAFFACELWNESRKASDRSDRRTISRVAYALCGLSVLAFFVLLYAPRIRIYVGMAMIGMSCTALVLAVFLLTRGEAFLHATAFLMRSFLLACGVGMVVWLGTSGCYAAFCELVLNGIDAFEPFLALLAAAFAVAAFVFLAGIPRVDKANSAEDDKEKMLPSKAYQVVFAYAELPIFLLLLGILYVYLIKIILSRHLPNGGINAYCLWADALYLFNLFAVSAFAPVCKPVQVFRRFGGFFMLPVIAMQSLAVGVRIFHYGLTLPRMVVLTFMAVTLVMAVGSLFRNGLSKALLTTAVLLLVLTVTPLNLVNLPLWQQSAALKQILVQNGMFENGKIVPKKTPKDVSAAEQRKIAEIYNYLNDFPDQLPEWLTRDGMKANFGFDAPGLNGASTDSETVWVGYAADVFENGLDVSSYDYIRQISWSGPEIKDGFVYTTADGVEHIAAKETVNMFVKKLYEQYGAGYHREEAAPQTLVLADGIRLLISNVDFGYNTATEEIENLFLDGYILCR